MNPEEYDIMYARENTYWWFQGRKNILLRMIERFNLLRGGKARVLDLGCGTGLILEEMARRTFAIGLDFSLKALNFCRSRGIENLVRGDVTRLPIKDGSVDLVLALDLLEHVEDDRTLLREVLRVLSPEGHILATVPAHQYLWSEHDEALHHYRRYSHAEFLKRIRECGFQPIKYSFVISFTWLPIVVFRFAQKFLRKVIPSKKGPKTHIILLPDPINSLLISILSLEGRLLERMNLPLGVSLLCIARKEDASGEKK